MHIFIAPKEAAHLALVHDHWLVSPIKNGVVADTLKIIEMLGHVQIDTISVVARAHHHILWSRNRGYLPCHLDCLQKEGRHIFEYWAHAAAYLPMSAYVYCQPEMKRVRQDGHDWFEHNKKIMQEVIHRIRSEGALSTLDFKYSGAGNNGGWGSSKPAKHALETLFMGGILGISYRYKFRKVYDLAERIYPNYKKKIKVPSEKDVASFLVNKCIRSLGIFSAKDVTYLRRQKSLRNSALELLHQLVADNKLIELSIGIAKQKYFMQPELYEAAAKESLRPFVRILSPFDNQLINRERLRDIFTFSYTMESYIPAAKRKLGYFALPILSHNGLIGTIDLKADRKSKMLVVNQLDFIKKVSQQEQLLLHRELKNFALFNECIYT